MNDADQTHPTPADLAAFDAGHLSPADLEAVERHLAGCAECGRRLDGLPEDPFVALVRAAADWTVPTAGATPQAAAPGETTELLGSSAEPFEVPGELAGHPKYRILGRLGSGGMGVVCKAVHRMMDRVVALKVPHRHLLDRPGFTERFHDEARAAARLVHPHIVLAHDAEQAGDLPFLVMEYVPGLSLDRLVARRGPLPVAEACDCVRQAALGLQYAHEQGMIHCDVKPANLLRTPAGIVKVLDFGLARLARSESTTPAGTLAGTPDYAAPEQARDPDHVDARADIYSLGCTLYFLLAGRSPFRGGTTLGKLLAHQDRTPPPVTEFRPDVPPGLVNLLDRLLAKDPARRPPSCAEVARLLEPFAGIENTADHREEPARTVLRKPRRWPWIVLPLAAAVLLLGILLSRPWTWTSAPLNTQPETQPAPDAPATDLASPLQIAALKKERREQALAWIRDNNAWGPTGAIIQHTAQNIDSALDQLESFQVVFGAKLLRSGQPALLAAHPGGFFVFPLTSAQSEVLQMDPTTRRWRVCRKAIDARRLTPRVRLSRLQIEHADKLPSAARVVGKVGYEVIGPPVAGPFAVRVTFYHRGFSHAGLLWFKRSALEGAGELPFDCPAVGSFRDQPSGPLAFFAEVVTEMDGKTIVESDACAALVDVAAPH
jgi:serine/threonine protein kinase